MKKVGRGDTGIYQAPTCKADCRLCPTLLFSSVQKFRQGKISGYICVQDPLIQVCWTHLQDKSHLTRQSSHHHPDLQWDVSSFAPLSPPRGYSLDSSQLSFCLSRDLGLQILDKCPFGIRTKSWGCHAAQLVECWLSRREPPDSVSSTTKTRYGMVAPTATSKLRR